MTCCEGIQPFQNPFEDLFQPIVDRVSYFRDSLLCFTDGLLAETPFMFMGKRRGGKPVDENRRKKPLPNRGSQGHKGPQTNKDQRKNRK